jgi:drug/metabolite transporter (DMT)-like permease
MSNPALGVFISLVASCIDALGLNILRKTHIQNSSYPPELQKHPCKMLLWHVGFYMYVGSQIFGSSGALIFLPPNVVAPLGAAALIFNVIFSKYLVGSKIIKMHLVGTLFVILGSILVAVFGSSTSETNLSLETLTHLFSRSSFVAYFSTLSGICLITFLFSIKLAHYGSQLTTRQRRNSFLFKKMNTKQIQNFCGVIFAVVGGIIASETLQLADTGVKLLKESISVKNQFTSFMPFAILIILVISGVTQVYCMNRGLKLTDASVIQPAFFAFYSIFSLINTNIFFDQWSSFSQIAYLFISVGIFYLIVGVCLLTYSNRVTLAQEEELQLTVNDTKLMSEYCETLNDKQP